MNQTVKIECRQCNDTGTVRGTADGAVCVCRAGARLLHQKKYGHVKRCANCVCVAPPCSYAVQSSVMMAPRAARTEFYPSTLLPPEPPIWVKIFVVAAVLAASSAVIIFVSRIAGFTQ